MSLEHVVLSLLEGKQCVKNATITGQNVLVTFDFMALNSRALTDVEQVGNIIQSRFPGTGFSIEAYNDVYVTAFPYKAGEAKLGSGVVATVEGRAAVQRVQDGEL